MKRETVEWIDKPLTSKQRKRFKKEHPGYRLCYRLRFPNAPLFISIVALIFAVCGPVPIYMLRWLQILK